MATVCTKHKPGVQFSLDKGGVHEAEIPVRYSRLDKDSHSVMLGASRDEGRFTTLNGLDYGMKHKDKIEEMQAKENQRRRITDMNRKHFIFGHAEPTMQSEVRGSLLPPSHAALTSREIRPIGGPNNKGASCLYISGKDVDQWTSGMNSTSRSDFTKTKQTDSEWDTKQHTRAMRKAHFNIGVEEADWQSTSQKDFNAPRGDGQLQSAAPSRISSVPLAYGRRCTPETHRTTHGMYGVTTGGPQETVRNPDAANIGRKSNMVLGYDAQDFQTESRNVFQENRSVFFFFFFSAQQALR